MERLYHALTNVFSSLFDVPFINLFSILVICVAAGIILRQETIDNAFRAD